MKVEISRTQPAAGWLLSALLMLPASGLAARPGEAIDEYIAHWVEFYPTTAFNEGLEPAAERFEDYSEEKVTAWLALNHRVAHALDSLPGNTPLAERVDACVKAGIQLGNLILDPGFGFGKTREQNFTLLNELEQIRVNHLPLLAGLSRKSMIGQTLGLDVNDRVNASIGLALLAVRNGANIVRVHDVKQTSDALRMVEAVENVARD